MSVPGENHKIKSVQNRRIYGILRIALCTDLGNAAVVGKLYIFFAEEETEDSFLEMRSSRLRRRHNTSKKRTAAPANIAEGRKRICKVHSSSSEEETEGNQPTNVSNATNFTSSATEEHSSALKSKTVSYSSASVAKRPQIRQETAFDRSNLAVSPPDRPVVTQQPSLLSRCVSKLHRQKNSRDLASTSSLASDTSATDGHRSEADQASGASVTTTEAPTFSLDLGLDLGSLLDDKFEEEVTNEKMNGEPASSKTVRETTVNKVNVRPTVLNKESFGLQYSSSHFYRTANGATAQRHSNAENNEGQTRPFHQSTVVSSPAKAGIPVTFSADASSVSDHSTSPGSNGSLIMSKEERLRLSKLKQQQFRERFEAKKQETAASGTSQGASSGGSVLFNVTYTGPQQRKNTTHTVQNQSIYSPASSTSSGSRTNATVLVDSREINGAQVSRVEPHN